VNINVLAVNTTTFRIFGNIIRVVVVCIEELANFGYSYDVVYKYTAWRIAITQALVWKKPLLIKSVTKKYSSKRL